MLSQQYSCTCTVSCWIVTYQESKDKIKKVVYEPKVKIDLQEVNKWRTLMSSWKYSNIKNSKCKSEELRWALEKERGNGTLIILHDLIMWIKFKNKWLLVHKVLVLKLWLKVCAIFRGGEGYMIKKD